MRQPTLVCARPCLIALAVAAICGVVFGDVRHGEFVGWDDGLHLYRNPYLTPSVTAAGVWHFWRQPYQGLYIPVSYTVFALLAVLARLPSPVTTTSGWAVSLSAPVFHTASLALHLANTLLVFGLLRRLVKNDWAAGAGALVFGLHPVQAEAVGWISELRGLLSSLFCLLALGHYVRSAQAAGAGEGRARYALATACFALALLSKPSAVALPLIAWIVDRGLLGRRGWASTLGLAAWGALSLTALLVTRAAQPIPPALVTPLWARPFVAGDALAFYLGKLAWPRGLTIDYGRTPSWVLGHPWGYATWLAPAALAGVVWALRRRAPWLPPAAGLFLAPLLPVLGLVPFAFQLYSTTADRYLYLALLGPALGVAFLVRGLGTRGGLAVGATIAGVLTVWGLVSATQIASWRNDFTLYRHALAVNPRDELAHYNFGCVLAYQGELAGAAAHFREAARLDPADVQPHNNLGGVLMVQGRPALALGEFRRAVQLAPDDPKTHLNMGRALLALGQSQAGQGELRQAQQLSTRSN